MLFVISGPSYVGKKTAMSHFMKLYSFSSIIPYTTKPQHHRVGEVEGIQYHYVGNDSRSDIENDNFIYDKPFDCENYSDDVLYAYKKSDIENAITSYANFIIHASVNNSAKIYSEFERYHSDESNRQVYFIFFDYESELDKIFFLKRMPEFKYYCADNNLSIDFQKTNVDAILPKKLKEPFERRYNHSLKERRFYSKHSEEYFDKYIKSDKPYEICEKMERFILPLLKVMPSSPNKKPGPLSDLDILYMYRNRKEDKLMVRIDGQEATEEQIKKLLCGCGIHITLANTIRVIKRSFVSKFIDMADSYEKLHEILNSAYPVVVIDTGYVLSPDEAIFCSSNETFHIPSDVYATVASKFSYVQLGLSVELSPNVIQSGHRGRIHFQIKNNTNNYICIYPNIEIAQLLFYRTIQHESSGYNDMCNHSYDEETIAPLSRFRENNEVLEKIVKSKKAICFRYSNRLEIKL